jgi:hypothetical protein
VRHIVRAPIHDASFCAELPVFTNVTSIPGGQVTVTFHVAGETFKIKALEAIIEDQAWSNEEDLRRLGLLK